jgi:Zn finger protein HypA/HybF involved in hydrogenase expression
MPNAKRKVYTMPRLRQQNKGTDTGGYRAKELPLFCPKCHKQTLINAKQLNITKAEVPDAKTQSR